MRIGKEKGTLLLVGKGISSKEFWLKELKDLGYELNCIDFELPGKFSKYFVNFFRLDSSEDVCYTATNYIKDKKWKVDGVLCIEEMYVPLSICLAKEFKKKVIASIEHSASLRNKYLMRKQFGKFGIENPDFLLVKNKQSLTKAIKAIGVPCVLKPVEMAGSLGVIKIKSAVEGDFYYDISRNCDFDGEYKRLYFNLSQDCLVEKFIDGREWSVEVAVQNGKSYLLAITSKSTGPEPYFDEIMHIIYNSNRNIKENGPLVRLAMNGIRALKIRNAICHVEIKTPNNESPKIIEIAARPAGDMIPYLVNLATGIDVVALAAKISLGVPIKIKYNVNAETTALIGFINSRKPGVIKKFEIKNTDRIKIGGIKVKIHKYFNKGQNISVDKGNLFVRVGHVIIESDTPENAQKYFNRILNCIDLKIR